VHLSRKSLLLTSNFLLSSFPQQNSLAFLAFYLRRPWKLKPDKAGPDFRRLLVLAASSIDNQNYYTDTEQKERCWRSGIADADTSYWNTGSASENAILLSKVAFSICNSLPKTFAIKEVLLKPLANMRSHHASIDNIIKERRFCYGIHHISRVCDEVVGLATAARG